MPPLLLFLRREYESLPRLFWAIWIGTLVNRAGAFVVPFLAIYVGRILGHGEVAAGAIVGLFGAGNFLAGLVGGVLTDRVGRRATMLISLFGGAAAMGALACARSLVALGVTTFAMGLLAEMYRPAVGAMVSDIVPADRRGRAFAHLYWGNNLGFAIAPALAGIALKTSYWTLFAVDGGTMVVYALVVLFRMRETRPAEAIANAGTSSSFSAALSDRGYLAFLALTFGFALVMWQNGSTLPLDMSNKGISGSEYGAIMAINGVLIVVVQPIATARLASVSRARILLVGAVLFGIGMGTYGFVARPAGYLVTIAIWTLAEIAIVPTSSAVVADFAPAAMRGRYQGLYAMAWGIASALAPVGGGFVLARIGSGALWTACFAIMLGVAAGYAVLAPRIDRLQA